MRRLPVLLLGLALSSASVVSLTALAQEGPAGGPPPRMQGDQGGAQNGPPRGAPGGVHLIPPFVREKLNLTADQQAQLAALEKETTDKVSKILTPAQMKILAETRPPRPRGGPGGGRGGPHAGQGGEGPGAGGSTTTPPPPDGMGPPQ